MAVSKIMAWIRQGVASIKQTCSRIQLSRKTEASEIIETSDPKPSIEQQHIAAQTSNVIVNNEKQAEKVAPIATKITSADVIVADETAVDNQSSLDWRSTVRGYRAQWVKGVGALGLLTAITIGGNQYVQMNTNEVFHVWVGDTQVGTVNDPQLVEDAKIEKYKEISQKYPDIHMIVNTDEVVLKSESAFKLDFDNETAIANLYQALTSHAIGTEVRIDGQLVGVVKDQDTADQLLEEIRMKYVSAPDEKTGRVVALSNGSNPHPDGESELQTVDFVEEVTFATTPIQPEDIVDPAKLKQSLETGDIQPTEYEIVKGDCVSCIAEKFRISQQQIYDNNPWIEDDYIKEGQVLNLTVLQPRLSVRTVEKLIESQEVQYDTEYILDDTMRAGENVTIQEGKNGLKQLTFMITKVNGMMTEESLVEEHITVEPIVAQVRKGTKVILGEGSGKFAWPVVSSTLSSGFGTRWGKLHKGIDLTSSKKSILASDNGKVTYAGYKSDYGNHVIIDHKNGFKTLYGHLSKIDVSQGQIVEKGEVIGLMGRTGDSTGVHLHFEIIKDGSVENPLKYLSR